LTTQTSRFRRDSVLLVTTSEIDPNLVALLATLRRRRISSEVIYVDPDMGPDQMTMDFLGDLRRERIAGYRMTRADHPSGLLQTAPVLTGLWAR
jgi:hypothetical protein